METWPKKFWKEGFGNSIFLTEEEWRTFLKRKPVRYANRKLLNKKCDICQEEGTKDNPLQMSHKISAYHGICYLALTPDFLDSQINLLTAHRKTCNKKVELCMLGALNLLHDIGIKDLPKFLHKDILTWWLKIKL